MGVLIYTETENGKFKKSAFELASYGRALADQMGVELIAACFNAQEVQMLATYGVDKVILIKNQALETFTAPQYASNIAAMAQQHNAQMIVLSSSANAKYMAGMLAAKINAGYVSNVVELPKFESNITVKRTAFSNKAFSYTTLQSDTLILGLSSNAYGAVENKVNSEIVAFQPDLPEQTTTQTQASQAS